MFGAHPSSIGLSIGLVFAVSIAVIALGIGIVVSVVGSCGNGDG